MRLIVRFLGDVAALVLAATVLLGLALVHVAPILVREAAPALASQALGVPVTLADASVGEGTVTLTGVTVAAPMLVIGSVEAGVDLDLLRRTGAFRLNALEIEGLTFSAGWTPQSGFDLPEAFNSPSDDGGAGIEAAPSLPFDRLEGPIAVDGTVLLTTPYGTTSARFDAVGEVVDARLLGSAGIEVSSAVSDLGPAADLVGDIAATLALDIDDTGFGDAVIDFVDGGLDSGPLSAVVVPGWTAVDLHAGRIRAVSAQLGLDLRVPGMDTPARLRLDILDFGGERQATLALEHLIARASLDVSDHEAVVAFDTGDAAELARFAQEIVPSSAMILPELQGSVAVLARYGGDPSEALRTPQEGALDLSVMAERASIRTAEWGAGAEALEIDGVVRWSPLEVAFESPHPQTITNLTLPRLDPVSAVLEPWNGPIRLTASTDGDEVMLDTGLTLMTPFGDAVAGLRLALSEQGRIEGHLADLLTGPVAVADFGLRLESDLLEFSHSDGASRLGGTLSVRSDPGELGAFRWRSLATELRIVAEQDTEGAFLLDALDGSTIRVDGAEIDGLGAADDLLVVSGTAKLDRSAGGDLSAEILMTSETPLGLRARNGSRTTLEWPNIAATMTMNPSVVTRLDMAVDGGRLTLPALSVDPVTGTGSLEFGSDGTTGRFDIAGWALTPRGALATQLPEDLRRIRVGGTARLDGDRVGFQGAVAAGGYSVPARISHRTDTGVGSADLGPVVLALGDAEEFDLLSLVPIPDRIDPDAVSGTVSSEATLSWRNGAPASAAARIMLEDIRIEQPTLTVGPVRGDFAVDLLRGQLIEPATLDAELVEVNLPLRDVSLTLSGPSDGTIRIDDLTAAVAGGEMVARAADIALNPLDGQVILDFSDMSLAELMTLAPVEGLAASAPISGSLPVRLGPEGLRIENGFLQATESGVLTYQPTQVPAFALDNAAVALLFNALEDFRFERLEARASGDPLGDLQLDLEFLGANPDLYGGYPFDISIGVNGPLFNVVGRTLSLNLSQDEVRDLIEGVDR